MKKILILLALLTVFTISFGDWQDVINNEEKQAEYQKIKQLNEDFNLKKFDTQENFESFLAGKLYDKIINSCSKNIYTYPLYERKMLGGSIEKGGIVANTATLDTTSLKNSSSKVSYGKTNLQKENVDEPEILKLTENNIAYFNKTDGKIYIISSPIKDEKINLENANITDTIKVPSLINKYSIKLFFVNNQLLVIGTRYSKAFGGQITDLVFYKIENGKANFSRLYDTKGNFKDARIVNNKIYLITNYNFSSISRKICQNYVENTIKDRILKITKDTETKISDLYENKDQDRYKKIEELRKTLQNTIKKEYDKQMKKIDKTQILKDIENQVKQKSIDIIIDKNARFKYKNKIYPINIKLVNSANNNILFVPTNFDKLNIYDLNFNLVNIVDLDTKQNPNQYIIFGNMNNGQIHMTTKSLYLVNNYYENYPWRCRHGLYCILPYYSRGNFTLIHKFSISGFKLNYVNSQIIPGRLINQYSMDEDSNGNFRIFTKHYYPQKATDLYVFDDKLKLKGKIQGIGKKEEFKSSRFIGDKAYLVTFKATDPLFVIDLKDLNNPKIIGELKIPGYSLYLHPLKKEGNIQYLLGIGQKAEEVYGNRSLPKNIKIDIYKIDYNNLSGGKIKVEQTYSYVLGDEKIVGNGGSYTPAFDNPRTFVYDKNQQILLLPVYLTKDNIEKRCNPRYKYKDGKRIIDGEYCYDYKQKIPYFIGVKGLKIDIDNGIKEVLSKNYIDLYKKVNNSLTQWRYKDENHRVSYYKIGNDFIPFEVNTNFIDFFKGSLDRFIAFNKLFKKEIKNNNINKKCFYKKPKPGTITCQMYCGKKWILENGKCTQIQINTACSCPGFDTKDQCKKECIK